MNSEVVSGDRSYIDGVIERMEKGTLEIGQLIVAYHIASEVNDSIPMALRFKWAIKWKGELGELVSVEGNNVGSANIDVVFQELVESRIAPYGFHEDTAWSMMHLDKFQQWKHKFGYQTDSVPVFKIPVPNIPKSESCEGAGIECGKMHFTKSERHIATA
ncbi:hypothetical protein BGAL_0007g00470 [Botrytis galanthina]|uniref:Uncharacterized protein n=1 Tax=Botrytis galanthina TaxID=278940 RepID=A0A4V4HW24_9HELO|nr:hypothetical protein BGAL_0007g00470 [Botrytis galanthina]